MKRKNGLLMVFCYICLSSVAALGLMAIGTGCSGGDNGDGGGGTASYTLADLEGTWYLRNICTGKNDQPDRFGYTTGTIIFQSDGSFTATFTRSGGETSTDSGTASISNDGIVTVTPDDGGSLSFVMSAGKNVLAGNSQSDDEFSLEILVKKAK